MSFTIDSPYPGLSLSVENPDSNTRATPTEIADSVGVARPHVSRALSQLKDKGVVELRVPEARTVNRYYGLTETGRTAWPEIQQAVQNVDWDVADPDSPKLREIVDLARDEFGEGLRCIGTYDGEMVTIWYIDPAVEASYSDREFEEGLRTLIFDHSLDEITVSGADCWSDTLHFGEFSVVRVRVADGSRIAVTFDDDENVAVPAFADAVQAVFEPYVENRE
ncbi:winged helix-turn-helix domain-containing protein [Salarchaeum sp. JOR-1]|uniref:winged helix-turn-helix domain-containing protein n=1 Tax=Salarchaeum sp. JOR-1 TaxID=2599399 RepID=UPI00143CD6B2|nr:winged helix-turn-helix domain-containing protein [Salarchaeum sp. JOR-1]